LEAESGELADKSNAFAYLSSTLPEGSESKRIYENYANELKAASDDMARNGLNIQNRRALVDLKRRYNGEIGRLQRADEALQKEKELRRNASMKDPSMLYANDNLTIDNFLEGSNPNLYSISGNDLYKRGATASQQASSRVYDNTQVKDLTKYYQEMIQRYGYNPKLLIAFRKRLSAIPELEAEVDSILKETGVEDNLTGNNYARARESVINGMIDGALYKEEREVRQNPGVLTAAESTSVALQREARDREDAYNGRTWNPKTKTWSYDSTKDMRLQEAASLTNDGNNGGGGSGNRGTSRYPAYNQSYFVSGRGETIIDDGTDTAKENFAKYRKSATRVTIEPSTAGTTPVWNAYVGTGRSKMLIGVIAPDASGNLTVDPGKAQGKLTKFRYERNSPITQITRTYNSSYDAQNVEKLLYDVIERMEDEGVNGYKNYQWYLSPKGASDTEDKGGFIRDALIRSYPTLYNTSPMVGGTGFINPNVGDNGSEDIPEGVEE